MVLNALRPKTKVSAAAAGSVGTSQYQMSHTQVTKKYAINIDTSLGHSTGELSGGWIYKTNKAGEVLDNGIPIIFTHRHRLVSFWAFCGDRVRKDTADNYFDSLTPYVKRRIKDAFLVNLVKSKMVTSDDTQD